MNAQSQDQFRWTTPDLGTGVVSTEPNTSSAYFEVEREKVFKRCWLNVGRVEEVPNPGDFIVKDVEPLKASVLIVRGNDGKVRAFHNICRHRGNGLTRACRGSAKGFSCGFHGWVYDLSGNLVHVPDEEQFFGLKKSELGLLVLTTDVWEGFIFIHASVKPEQTLKEFMGDIGASLEGYPFSDLTLDVEYGITVDCNWKVFSDAFQEGYHVGFIHKNTFPTAFCSKDNPFLHMFEYRLGEFHNAASVYGNPDYAPTPVDLLMRKIGTSTYGAPSAKAAIDGLKGLNPQRHPHFMFEVFNFFPNFTMHVGAGFYYSYNFWPVSVNKTRWVMRLYGHPARNAGERISKEYTKVLLRDAVKEDINTTESTQRNMDSGVLPYMVLCDQEVMLRQKYGIVDRMVKV